MMAMPTRFLLAFALLSPACHVGGASDANTDAWAHTDSETDAKDTDTDLHSDSDDSTDTDDTIDTVDTDDPWQPPTGCEEVDCTTLEVDQCDLNPCCHAFEAWITVGEECLPMVRYCWRIYYPSPWGPYCDDTTLWVDHPYGPGCMLVNNYDCLPEAIRSTPCDEPELRPCP